MYIATGILFLLIITIMILHIILKSNSIGKRLTAVRERTEAHYRKNEETTETTQGNNNE
ncbi:MAG: hypothetical protein ACQEQV_01780 [Fibrobacterota bacterium]